MRRKIQDEQDARACLKAAKAAGLSAGAWARQHGIDGRSLKPRRRAPPDRLGRAAREIDPPRVVELVPAGPARAEARYVVRVAGAEIEVTDAFQEETLVRLVRALRSC